MKDPDKEELLNQCITTCAEFEVKTGVKTAEMRLLTQIDAAKEYGLSLKDIKKWTNSAKTAIELIS